MRQLHKLTVVNGKGSGVYMTGRINIVEANPASVGEVFDKWEGLVINNPHSNRNTVILENKDVTVTAIYKKVA